MMNRLLELLRKYLTCRVLGHDWRVWSWADDRNVRWDNRTWRCFFCFEGRRTSRIWDDPGTGKLLK